LLIHAVSTVRERFTSDESDRMSSGPESLTERLLVRTFVDTGLRVG
jgi:hypothetical protein